MKTQPIYHGDFSKRSEEEYEAFLMEDTPIEQFKREHPEWSRQIDALDQGITDRGPEPWEEGTDEKLRFALILTKCRLFVETLGGEILAVEGPFPGEASILMDIPFFTIVSDLGENLLCYLGRYASSFSAHPQGEGVRIQIGLPYPSGKE